MRKLGLIGRWGVIPAAGLHFDGKPRLVSFSFNTTAKTVITVRDLPGRHNGGEVLSPVLLGAVDGLETFEFRVPGPFKIEVEHYDPETPSQVWYATDEGMNFAIDGEAYRDFTVPMIGRRERNEALDALRFEMRQELRQQQAMFRDFMEYQQQAASKAATTEAPANGKGDKTNVDPDKKPVDGKAPAGGAGGNNNGGSGAKVDPKRAAPADADVQQPADKANQDGGASSNT